jgi:hypothetical protein
MPAIEQYEIGDAPVVTILTKNISGTLTDPTTLTVHLQRSGAASTSYVYGTAPEVTRSTTGTFAFAVPTIAGAGYHQIRVVATGAVAAAEQTKFNVVANNIT